jgi:predicted nucleic acid-binding protein
LITAVDTNVLLDIVIPDAPHEDASAQALTEALSAGATVISEAVYAELSAHFTAREDLDRFLRDTGIRPQPSSAEALYLAGKTWREYLRRRPELLVCPSCGTRQDLQCVRCETSLHPRSHVIADFLIGAHATVHADRMLTRDLGYYRTYFVGLRLV